MNAERPSPECYKIHHTTLTDQINGLLSNSDDSDGNDSEGKLTEIRNSIPLDKDRLESIRADGDGDSGQDDDNDSDSIEDDNNQETGTEDVHLSFSRNGQVFECSSQVENYRFHAAELNHVSVWDFVSTVDNVTKSANKSNDGSDEEPSDNEGDDNEDSDDDIPSNERAACVGPYKLQIKHRDYSRKVQRIRKCQWKHFVPVPIGPALPRCDRPELFPRYARLMLLLFKPWRTESDLHGDTEDWPEAFSRFLGSCTPEMRQILDNIQLLHECKDSSQSMRRKRNRMKDRERQATRNKDSEEADMNEIINHLDSIENYYSQKVAESQANVDDCLQELQAAGMFVHMENNQATEATDVIMLPDDNSLEDQWKNAYENCRNEWKWKLGNTHAEADTSMVHPHGSAQLMTVMSATDASCIPVEHRVMQLATPSSSRPAASVDDIIPELSLNTEQARAFRIIAIHSIDQGLKPLRMYIGGPGGTGKSRVIQALTDFFKQRGESRRLRLASFTGAAAKNIGGTTLHTALCLSPTGKNTTGTKTQADLVAMWDGVDHLLVDEVSMIGCSMMADIHDALVNATGCTDPFGGINVIFAGDFAQLPPVGDTKLYMHLNYGKLHTDTLSGQKTVVAFC